MNLYHDLTEHIFYCVADKANSFLVSNDFSIYKVISNNKSFDYLINSKVSSYLEDIGKATNSDFPDDSLLLMLYMNLKPETKDWLNRINGHVILDRKN